MSLARWMMIGALVLGPALGCAGVALAQPGVQPTLVDLRPMVVVSGTATMPVAADELRMDIAVVSEADQAQAAVAENSKKAERVIDALQKKGLEKSELFTGGFSIQPVYSQPRPGQTDYQPKVVGYRVENTLRVKTGKLTLAGDLIEVSVAAGANRVDSVSFGLADGRKSRAEVIAKAVANARADAEASALASGVKLGRVLRISVDSAGSPMPPPVMFRAARMEADGGAPPMLPGEVQVNASVTVEYAIEP